MPSIASLVSAKKRTKEDGPDVDVGADLVVDRGSVYGPPEDNHNRTARLWRAYLGGMQGELDAVDVCMLNVLQKIARAQNGVYHSDHFEDIIGYARNAETVWRIVRNETTNT